MLHEEHKEHEEKIIFTASRKTSLKIILNTAGPWPQLRYLPELTAIV